MDIEKNCIDFTDDDEYSIMDFSVVTKEIEEFINHTFADMTKLCENELHLIEDNCLTKPKENYIFLIKLLGTLVKRFIHLDHELENSLLDKLYKDICALKAFYDAQEAIYFDIYDSFNEIFINQSTILKMMLENVNDEEGLQKYKKLHAIYYEEFSIKIDRDRKKLLFTILVVLNSKIFFLDRLLWKEANRSEPIRRFLQAIKIEGSINSKNYILYKLENDQYSKNYSYLQKCLRIYK